MKLCFLSLNAYPVLAGENFGYAGGAEVEQVYLARELINHGYDISFVTYRCGSKQIENIDGIKVIETYEREKATNTSIFVKSMSLWSSLREANADIYFYEAGSYGLLSIFCRLNKRKFIYRVASNANVLGKSLDGRYNFYENMFTIHDIKTANIVVAQSAFQQQILRQRFGIESMLIKNGLMLPLVDCEKSEIPIVLWVGSLSKIKNADIFLELAKSLPNVQFEMIGGEGDDKNIFNRIKTEAGTLQNLHFYGFVPFHEINKYFRRASILVNTSSIEGFPNTFIQAWANYTPVISLNVDPDNIIQNEKLGFCSGTFKQLISDVATLLEDENLRKTLGENARKYVEEEHDIKNVVNKYTAAFKKFCK